VPKPPHPDQLLALAIARAYTAFEAHELGESMTVRRTDVQPDDVLALAQPLREVEPEAIDRWLPHAATTWGQVSDLRALLPRTLELFAAGRLTTTPEVLFSKLEQVGIATWPLEERAAVADVCSALWLATVSAHPARIGYPAWRVLVGLAELDEPLTPYLDDWHLLLPIRGAAGQAARAHLTDLEHRAERVTAKTGDLGALFFTPRPREAARLDRWLSAPYTAGS
jgi:hypothetical protein